jgi:p-hydroxybenzoate 3-monooxygenase
VVVYPQHEVLVDLIGQRLADGGDLRFGVADVAVDGIEGEPSITFTHDGAAQRLECDFVVGADGSHSQCRKLVTGRRDFFRQYPFAWFGILAEAPPSYDELIYAHSERGFVLVSTRSPTVQRLYFQCDPATAVDDWSDDRIWAEFSARLAPAGVQVQEGRSSRRTCCSSARSSPSRCSGAGSSWWATRRTPCRRPGPRA